jgi:hypothetical protein
MVKVFSFESRLKIDNPIEEAAQCYYRDAKQLLLDKARVLTKWFYFS